MPRYDYRCPSCEEQFEVTQLMSAPAGATCPSCANRACERIPSMPSGIHLKGAGFSRDHIKATIPSVDEMKASAKKQLKDY